MNDDPPQLIHLRLSAALLSSLSQDDVHLTLTHENDNADTPTSSLVVSRGTNTPSEEHPLQVTESQFDWYRTASSDGNKNEKKLSRIGSTKHNYTVQKKKGTSNAIKPHLKLDTSTTNLKRIGAQTRKLLDEERKKRKEIVRLNDEDFPSLLPPDARHVAKPTTVAQQQLQQQQQDEEGETLRKDIVKTTNPKKKARVSIKHKRRDPTIDSYMPNAEELISKAVEKGEKSNILRMHGLPVGIRASDIRKFFHGLNPIVFVLPSLFDGYIDGWDVNKKKDDDNDGRNKKCRVFRYPESFRVYVKFQSVLVADAALERIGESIGFDVVLNGCEEGVIGAAVSLSFVPKHVAKFLEKHLAIYPRKGEAISDTLAAVEKRIGKTVINFAWIMTAIALKLDTEDKSTRLHKLFTHQNTVPNNIAQYNSLVKVFNHLIEQHERLEMDVTLLLMHSFDPSCVGDSAHRIAHSVSNFLLDTIGVIENNLAEARQCICND